jgi:sterol desaturase/sphingolipid hydroxylase (fatty acid hydroxylase superfamily)
MSTKEVPLWLRATLVLGTFGTLVWLERRRPLRRAVEPKFRREARNLAVAATSAAAVQLADQPITGLLTGLVERRRWGLLKRLPIPAWLELPLVVALLDYTLYLWHVLVHKVPFLWRFHQPHHVDLDLDASTALRFHFGEMLVSVPWRGAQILVIGASPRAVSVWQTALLMEVLFHHSNVALSVETERRLGRWIVTPRMHGIHHSIVPEETNSNWSSGLTIWDWLHGTLRLNVPQQEIIIGLPAYRDPADVTLPKVLAMPFGPQRPSWELPGGGGPSRPSLPLPEDRLLA